MKTEIKKEVLKEVLDEYKELVLADEYSYEEKMVKKAIKLTQEKCDDEWMNKLLPEQLDVSLKEQAQQIFDDLRGLQERPLTDEQMKRQTALDVLPEELEELKKKWGVK